MSFKSYPTKKDTPSRKTRKGMRCTVFLFNKKEKRLARKTARIARRIVE